MIPVRTWPRAALTLARTFGLRGAGLRARHEWRRATGGFEAQPRATAVQEPPGGPGHRSPFHLETEIRSLCTGRAERVLDGFHQAYRATWRPLPASVDEWLCHPDTGHPWDPQSLWWQIPHVDPARGDIKDLWEPARFAWVFDLIRGDRMFGDERYAEAFRLHFGRWFESSPPYRGPHWSCGQEVAIRAVALLYAEANLALGEVAGPLVRTLVASGERIADAMDYAVSQRNNHAISEAAALVALGCRFIDSDRDVQAREWLRRGRAVLERSIREQFSDDGWYIQHSFNYLRVALDQCVVAERSLRAIGQGLSAESARRIRAAVDLLMSLMSALTGLVPNHGANDGAFVHPITSAPFRDYRPVVTAVASLWNVPVPDDLDLDPETLAWLQIGPAPRGRRREDGVRILPSGLAVIRCGPFEVFLRAGRYDARPGHLDPLHLDVRVDGREWIVDPGTYAYNAPPPWNNGLAGEHAHNGPRVEGRPAGVRGPRFLWLLWPEARIVDSSWSDGRASLVAEASTGVRRTVDVTAECLQVRDELVARSSHAWRVGWLLHPDVDPGRVETVPPGRIREAEPNHVEGWFSPRYGERTPSSVVEVRSGPGEHHSITTTICVADGRAQATLKAR